MSDNDAIISPQQPRRRSQQERRAETLFKILNAGVTTLVDKGYANFTTSNVAKASGVSRGAQLTNFETKRDLLISTAEFAFGEATKIVEGFAAYAKMDSTFLPEFVSHIQNLCESRLGIAIFEIVIAMRTDRELRDALSAFALKHERRCNLLWKRSLIKFGYSALQAERITEITTNLMQGAAVHVNRGPTGRRPKVGAHWREILIAAFPMQPTTD